VLFRSLEYIGRAVEQALVDELLDDSLIVPDDAEPHLMEARTTQITSNNLEEERTQLRNDRPPASNQSQLIEASTSEQQEQQSDTIFENPSSERSASESSSVTASTSQSIISVFIRFVNESVRKISVKPADTIQVIKQMHFGKELSTNKIVRFIYQGQFLKDTNTLESYNIRDQTTIHCHITSRQPMASDASSAPSSTSQPIATTVQRAPSTETTPVSMDQEPVNSATNVNLDEMSLASSNGSGGTGASTMASTLHASRLNSNRNSLSNIEYGTILLPLLTILLASAWFFRINFKQFFSPLYNLFLVFITFVYGVFLIVHLYRIFNYVNRHPNTTRLTTQQVN